jgi:hypothetical protein
MKREVKLIGLSYSQSQSHSYVAVLSEVNGLRKLPVIVKTPDAQTIALKLEKMKSPRPLTHDLIKSVADGFNIDCQEVCVFKVLEGIFYCKMTLNNGVDDIEIETTVGDAISMSLIFDCPLYVTEEVLASCGIHTDDEGAPVPDAPKKKKKENVISIDDLKKMMNEAIENEEYEIAAELRDKITKMEK